LTKSVALPSIAVPARYNYVAAFLTFACNLKCPYCINHYQEKIIRRPSLSAKEWARGLNRLMTRPDLPITFQGGEPSLHPDFIELIQLLKPELPVDILTNLQFDIDDFIRRVRPERLKRDAPYASIRVSYHPQTMAFEPLLEKVLKMTDAGFSVGIWSVKHPQDEDILKKAQGRCRERGIDFRFKEFLGEYQGKLYGTYKYQGSCEKKFRKKVSCRTSELLMDPAGQVYRCHADLYAGKNPVGDICDPTFAIEDVFRPCDIYGFCNPCDVKLKTNRFQKFGHTSVEIHPL